VGIQDNQDLLELKTASKGHNRNGREADILYGPLNCQ
jgi:hypothetical protein